MTKAAAKSADATDTKVVIVLGYDEDQKPRAARFPAADANLVAKAAQVMDLKVYEATTEELAALAKKLPLGRLYSNGKGFVPNVRQNLYSQIIVELAAPASGRRRQRQRRAAGGDWPAPNLGRDRAWPPCHRPGSSGIRLVGSHRYRSQRRHAYAAVSGLPEAAQVLTPSCGSRTD
jgi:hypothetical protein